MRLTLQRIAGLLFLLLALNSSAPAAIINGFDADRHERFLPSGAANPNFLLNHDLITGVAVSRAILISPMHYITAVHAGSTMPTFMGSDGTLRTYESAGSVALTTNLPGGGTAVSDVALHTLTAPIPVADGVTPLAIADGNLADFVGKSFFVFDQNERAGRNVIDGLNLVANQSGTTTSFTIRFSYDTDTNGGTGGLGADEAGLLGGDSGNGAVIEIGGQMALIGAHFGIIVPPGSSAAAGDRYDSFSTLLQPYLGEIRSIVEGDGQSITTLSVSAVPEPSFTLVLCIVAGAVTARRPRRV